MATVMIVEDSMIMRHSIKRILIELGHKVISEAANGFESIEKYKLMKPDIVTMDITMPGENGIENGIDALVEIKKINKDANVIMLTSHGEQKLVIQAVSKGAKGYILKPVTKEKIADAFGKITLKT
ncbi:MAG: response regulator [Campylobacterota bacterium]|nr:response regulator [Campylobacterota bacterium]